MLGCVLIYPKTLWEVSSCGIITGRAVLLSKSSPYSLLVPHGMYLKYTQRKQCAWRGSEGVNPPSGVVARWLSPLTVSPLGSGSPSQDTIHSKEKYLAAPKTQ